MRTLVVVAHPDDETLGVGGTIAKWGDCTVMVMADGVTSRDEDASPDARRLAFYAATKALGVIETHSCDLPDQRLDTYPLYKLARQITRAIELYRPDRILTHHLGDLNKDHRLTAEAVLVACRPPNRCEILTFETPSSTEWAYGMEPAFRPNVFVDIGSTLECKCVALGCYEEELREYPHPRSTLGIERRAMYWGQMAGLKAAEPLILLRGYR